MKFKILISPILFSREYLDKKKVEMLDIFEKSYQVALEELAAKDGTGKKYGRPKRFI